MTNFNSEGQPEGDWEDRGNLSWSELDWQHFLQRRDKETARFLSLYDECPVGPTERLDWVARQMGWDTDDWSVGDFPDEEEDQDGWKRESTSGPDPDMDPYTLHRHPVYIVSTGLFLQLRHMLRTILKHKDAPMNALICWDFSDTLNEAEKHCLLALQCMDMGDFMLSLVHMKRALRGINLTMSVLAPLAKEANAGEVFRQAILARLFDLRDVCIRVIMDCRGESQSSYGD